MRINWNGRSLSWQIVEPGETDWTNGQDEKRKIAEILRQYKDIRRIQKTRGRSRLK